MPSRGEMLTTFETSFSEIVDGEGKEGTSRRILVNAAFSPSSRGVGRILLDRNATNSDGRSAFRCVRNRGAARSTFL